MKEAHERIAFSVVILVLGTLACSLLTPVTPEIPGVPPIPEKTPVPGPGFGPITFSEYVADDGQLVNPSSTFPAGTRTVYAYFTYWGMEAGQDWGQYWTNDGFEYVDGMGEAWDEGQEGWVAYYIEDLESLSGEFTLTLYIGDQAVQSASFEVTPGTQPDQGGAGAFGNIQFAEEVTDELVPIGAADEFGYGITEVYALFPYFHMRDGQGWSREWVYEGEVQVASDLVWDEGPDGLTYASFGYEDDPEFPAGTYTLNLYIGDELAGSASFDVLPETAYQEPEAPQGPADPEDIIDPNLMPAWEMLAYSQADILRDIAQFSLDHHIKMVLADDVKSKGVYRCSPSSREPGTLYIQTSFWKRVTWEEVAATMAHELTHAVQHIERGACVCTIENEYYAFVTEFYVLQETGRMDLLEDKWRGAYDENGGFSPGKLWAAIKDAYPECPDY